MTGTLVITHGPEKGTVEWDTTQNGGGPLDPVHAKKAFERLVSSGGMFAFADVAVGDRAGTREQIRSGGFDPETQTKVTLTPQIAGGCS